MAITASFVHGQAMRDAIKNGIALNWAGTSPDTFNVALFNNTLTPSPDTDPATYGSAPYNANEVSGTNWASGGVALGTLTNAISTGVGIKLSAANVSVATTTLSNARGCLIYDNTLSPKCGFIFVNFGADYSTTAGTFAINWDGTNGIVLLDLTP